MLAYYLRCYDHILQRLDERELLDTLTLQQLVEFTNALCDEWPLRNPDWSERHPPSHDSDPVNYLDVLSTDIPLAERLMYIALDTRFLRDHFVMKLQQARDHIDRHIEDLRSE